MTPTALIITLQMEPDAAARLTRMRQTHFPAHRNWLAAHVTLFHALPLEATDDVLHDVAQLASTTDPFAMRVDRVLFLGGGVAYAISSVQAMDVRRSLATSWDALLGRQDKAWHGPLHVTIQNKVQSEVARTLHAELERDFIPYEIDAIGLQVWHYVGGPWRHLATCMFESSAAPLASGSDHPSSA
jgi:hypothetical protein